MITDDQILQAARAYLKYQVESPELSNVIPFARHMAALEREACAVVCDGLSASMDNEYNRKMHNQSVPDLQGPYLECAEQIRSRG